MTISIADQILNNLRSLLVAAGTDAGASVHIDRTEETPFEVNELPAVNLFAMAEKRATPAMMGAALGRAYLIEHTIDLVLEVYTRGGPPAAAAGRLIAAQCEAALAADPTVGSVCTQILRPTETRWSRDDASEQKLFKTQVLHTGAYRTHSNAVFTPI
jgi:hypothetical protein